MKMSAAALPPIQPSISEANRNHPLFSAYMEHRNFCNRQLIQASSFEDWLSSRERNARDDQIATHPRFSEFQTWMRANKGGARRCPVGNAFPQNFLYWLDGGRW